jgi:signal transduction histidine kinase
MPTLTDDQLLTLNRAGLVAQLLAGAAHEVNNALLVISGTAELLEDGIDTPAAAAKGLARIRSQATKAAAALDALVTFAHGTSNTPGRVDLRDAVAAAIALRRFAIARAGLSISSTAPAEGGFVVDGSPVLMQQAILNLLTNAESALAGVPGGTIRVDLEERDGRALLRVADSGPGVPPDQRARIFEAFRTTTDHRASAGLGLAAARCIAGSTGGDLELEDPASGASFVMAWPLKRAPH